MKDNYATTRINQVEAGNPPCSVYEVELDDGQTQVRRSFGSVEHVRAYQRGIEDAAGLFGGSVELEVV